MKLNNSTLRRLIGWTKSTLYVVLSIIILLGVWEIVVLSVDNELLLPSFSQALKDLCQEFVSIDFYTAFGMTLARILLSFLLSLVLAFLLYNLAKINDFLQTFVHSIVSTLRSFPTIAIILFLLIWTTNQIAPFVICILVIMPLLYAGLQGLKIDNKIINMCKIYGIKKGNYFKFVYFPKLQEVFVPTLASCMALNVKIMVAAEVLAITYRSLGGLMQSASVYFEMGQLLALSFITIITAIILEKLILLLQKFHFKLKK